MKKYKSYFLYFLYWMIYFVVCTALFLVYHHQQAHTLSSGEIFEVFGVSLRMDASFTGYICILPFLLWLIKSVFPGFRASGIIRYYTFFLIIVLSFLVAADLELYTAWGFRMDATPLEYFKSPKEMTGSISSSPVWLLLLIGALLAYLFIFLYRFVHPFMRKRVFEVKLLDLAISLFLFVVLFIPIRGGIQKIPMNLSDVYFSDNLFADHAAINLPWNISFSILNRGSDKNPFTYFTQEKAESLVNSLQHKGPDRSPKILSTKRPNVIFIILESFTAKLVGSLGGVPGITPQLDSIASNGLLFTNIYAAGDRSEKGQAAVLSGYPNQAIHSIIKRPKKTRNLYSLCKTLSAVGYHCSYTYGGELEFANIKSYLINTGYKQLVSKYSFPIEERTTSWGVHDQYVFDRFFKDLNKADTPFFSTIFSLSSHEPYDVPLVHFRGDDETVLFENSVYYTDSVLGTFIRRIRKEPWWQNTLVVITADHGHPLPGNDPVDKPSKFHIPLIFTGGALTLKGKINTIGSQTDIAATVLHQLGISADIYRWSKDLLDSSARHYAFYSFNDGFGWVSKKGVGTIDNISRRPIRITPGFDTSALKYGKAYMQATYQDYLDR